MRAIDADTLMKRLKVWDTNDATDKALYNFALNRVLEAPTVEPEHKTGPGRWINIRHDNIAECSNCGITGRAWMNFCFNCGTDMREEDT